MIGSSRVAVSKGSVSVPSDFVGNHFETVNPSTGQASHMHSHDMKLCRWWEVNTSAGVYNWSWLDAKVAAYGGGPWTYCMFGTPTWASARPSEAHVYGLGRMAEPSSMTYLSDYVTALVTRYPTLTHIEVWNEPDIPSSQSLYWYSGTVATFVTLCQTIYTAAKAVRAGIKVIGPGTTYYLSSPNWLDAFFAAGGATYLDAISSHFYQLQFGTKFKAMLGVCHNYQYMQAALSKAGITGKDIYCTEFGQINPIGRNVTDQEYIDGYRRAMIVAAGCGFKYACWYHYDGVNFGYSGRTAVESAVADTKALLNGATISNVVINVSDGDPTVTATINGTTATY